MSANAVIIPIVSAVQLKNVLYATDFSEAARIALPLVATLARRYQSTVFVAHISEPHGYPLISPESASVRDDSLDREVCRHMYELLGDSLLNSLSTRTLLKSGNLIEELEKIVHEQHIDLAVLGTHGRQGFKRLRMGSVAEAAFRNLLCPVLTVGPNLLNRFADTSKITSILFPTDLSKESMSVFPYLASLAHEYHAKITVLHVLPQQTANNPDARSLAEPIRKQMERTFSPLISPECEIEFVIDAGDASECILEQARSRDVDLIGLGVCKAGEITIHFRNTVTYRVVVEAPCPVLTHRS
jgi:nucleotide-binding universal stress UspA family protein